MSQIIYLKWEEVNVNWEDLNKHWEDVYIEIEEAIRKRGGGYEGYVKDNPWKKLREDIGEEKTKRVVKLYCSINGIDYEKVSETLDIRVTVSEFERFVKNNIRVNISNIK